MTYSKADLFSPQQQELASYARVLSHPARLAIMQYISNCRECISGDISEEIPLSRTTVSQHLKELKKIGLIKGSVSGTKINYCLNPDTVNKMNSLFQVFLEAISHKDVTNCGNAL